MKVKRNLRDYYCLMFVVVLFGYTVTLAYAGGDEAPDTNDFSYELDEPGNGIVIKKWLKDRKAIVRIPSEIEGFPVVKIEGGAFSGKSFTTVIIPDTVTVIENAAFSSSGIEYITLPPKLKGIIDGKYQGDGLFSFCKSLRSVTIPNGITRIGSHTFNHCDALNEIIIPDSVKEIGSGAFWSCPALTEINLPSNLTSIGDNAFAYSGLKKIIILRSVTTIGKGVFNSCGALTEIVIQNNFIGESMFNQCRSLTEIIIPDSVSVIGAYAFSGCNKLHNVTVNTHKIQYYSSNAFSGCPLSLTSQKAVRDTGYTGGFN